jgi:paraquat-inducible protein A
VPSQAVGHERGQGPDADRESRTVKDDHARSLARCFPGQAIRLKLGLALASVLLGIGLFAPVITLEKLLFVTSTFSLVSGAVQLLLEGQLFLFLVVAAFSIVLPVIKIIVLFRFLSADLGRNGALHRYVHWIHLYGRWSMLDVFVVAILVVSVKLGVLASVQMRYGLYAFAASVLLTMAVTARIVSLSEALESGAGDRR